MASPTDDYYQSGRSTSQEERDRLTQQLSGAMATLPLVSSPPESLLKSRSALSDTELKRKALQALEEDRQREEDEFQNNLSPWELSTSPMLSSLHMRLNHHSPLHAPQQQQSQRAHHLRRNRRSFSFDDSHANESHAAPTTSTIPALEIPWLEKTPRDESETPTIPEDEAETLEGKKSEIQAHSGRQTPHQSAHDSANLSQRDNLGLQASTRTIPKEEESTPVSISIMYGMINATIVLPVVMSFGSIIYRDEAFQPYLNVLIKMTMVSGVVHQLCFSALSNLTFAVGSVQDAGLIFLSSMASTLVTYCRSRGDLDDEQMLATVTVGLSLSTAILGVALVLIGRFKLAQYVQMLPTCVVGGYLAFIGFFCGMSGVGLMAGTSEVTWSVVVEKIEFILPGILGGLAIYTLVRTLRHMAVLPLCIVALFLMFYCILWIQGVSVEDATDKGWIAHTEPPPIWYKTWDFIKLDKVVWAALPQLLLTELSMIFVVALSSSLDIAAIELELKRPLDFNNELEQVGISNVVSGLTGGYTGSYIFSQSIFTLRAGIRSRLAGFVLAGCEIIFLVIPFSALAYVPSFFFGSLLSLICIDLVFDWLIDSRQKFSPLEYLLCLATFFLILLAGVEYGILLGATLYAVCKKAGLDLGESNFHSDEHEAIPGSLHLNESHHTDAASALLNGNGVDGKGYDTLA